MEQTRELHVQLDAVTQKAQKESQRWAEELKEERKCRKEAEQRLGPMAERLSDLHEELSEHKESHAALEEECSHTHTPSESDTGTKPQPHLARIAGVRPSQSQTGCHRRLSQGFFHYSQPAL